MFSVMPQREHMVQSQQKSPKEGTIYPSLGAVCNANRGTVGVLCVELTLLIHHFTLWKDSTTESTGV